MPFYKDTVFWRIFAALAFVKTAAFMYICFFHPLGETVLIFPDSLTYVYPAQTLLQQGTFWEAVSAQPMLLRTPGYPIFLAGIQALFGNLTWAVALVQNILSLLLLIPVYLTAKRLSGQRAARWATGFCAASVLYFSLSFAVLTESLCVFLLAWFVFFCIRFLQRPQTSDLLWAAFLLTAAIYVRPAAYYFMAAASIIWVCFCIGKQILFPVRKIFLAFILPLVLGVGIWQLRNMLQTGFSGFTSVGAYNLYMWNEDYLAQKFSISISQAHHSLEQALPPGFQMLPPKEQVRIYKAKAFPLIRESILYKLIHAPLWAAKTLFGTNFVHLSRLLTGAENSTESFDQEMLNHTGALHLNWLQNAPQLIVFCLAATQVGITLLLGCFGFFLLWKKHRTESFFLVVYCLYFWGIGSTFFGAYARFRAPFEFVLCIAAGTAAAWLIQYCRKEKNVLS